MRLSCWFVAIAILSLVGCDKGSTSPQPDTKVLERLIESQSVRIKDLEEKVQDLSGNLFLMEMAQDSYKAAVFDPASGRGFERVDTSVGTFLISIEDIQPNADGVKLQLSVGNLTTASVNGGTFKARWGARLASNNGKKFEENLEVWKKQLHEVESGFTEELRPGAWNKITLTLPGIPPEQFGHLELSMDAKRVKLYTQN